MWLPLPIAYKQTVMIKQTSVEQSNVGKLCTFFTTLEPCMHEEQNLIMDDDFV